MCGSTCYLIRIPQVKLVLKVTLVALILMILTIPVSHLDETWAQVAVALIVVLNCVGFIIPNNLDRHRSRR